MKLQIVKVVYDPTKEKLKEAWWPANGDYRRTVVEEPKQEFASDEQAFAWITQNTPRLVATHGNTLYAHYINKIDMQGVEPRLDSTKIHGIGGIDEPTRQTESVRPLPTAGVSGN